jgi:hypothetical protein
MVYFQTKKIPIWVNFLRALDWKMLMYFIAIRNILRTFGISYDHLVHFCVHLVNFPRFGIVYQEKSGNPGVQQRGAEKKVFLQIAAITIL